MIIETSIKQSLPVMESFYTIQGEGYHQGKAAYFIRLAGCDVGCVWCDVKDSWDASKHPLISVEKIVEKAQEATSNKFKAKSKKNIVVVTGGEPLMHSLTPLTKALRAAGFETNIETSGAHALSGEWDWICYRQKNLKHR